MLGGSLLQLERAWCSAACLRGQQEVLRSEAGLEIFRNSAWACERLRPTFILIPYHRKNGNKDLKEYKILLTCNEYFLVLDIEGTRYRCKSLSQGDISQSVSTSVLRSWQSCPCHTVKGGTHTQLLNVCMHDHLFAPLSQREKNSSAPEKEGGEKRKWKCRK